jgi:hypothetical protein
MIPFASSASIALPNANINIPLVSASIQQRLLHHINANQNPPVYSNAQQNQQTINSLARFNNLLTQHHHQQQLQQQLTQSLLNNMQSIVSYPLNGREQISFNPRVRIPRIHFLDRSLEVRIKNFFF